MFFQQLKVVLWKNLIIRKRHWFLSIIESVLPILLFLLIAYITREFCETDKIEITKAQYNNPHTIKYDEKVPANLYYAPDLGFYQDIMKRVQFKFRMKNDSVKGFSSSDSLLNYYNSHNPFSTAIIFKGKDKRNLEYIIRTQQSYLFTSTAQLYQSSYRIYPGLGTPYDEYLPILKALDLSFIEKVSGKNLDDNLTLTTQEFPFPPHKKNSLLNTLFLDFLPIFTLLSFIFISPAVLKRVVEEKYSGTKELMKMVGMKTWMLWLGWFIHGMIPMLFSVICVVILLKVPLFTAECSPIEYTDGSVLFIFLLLYCMAAMVFCFAISSLFNRPTIAMVAGILIWILSYFVPKYGLNLNEMGNKYSWSLNILLNLLPNMALHYGYLAVAVYEERHLGVQWNNFYKSSSGGIEDVTVLNVFMMLIIDMIVYITFTLYMDGVNPGKYGVRKPFLFPIYSFVRLVKQPAVIEGQQGTEPLCMEYVEQGRGLIKGIEIQGLVKSYGHKLAVNNLNLNIYQNQITVLLGHNGAGKSTTMSIITGMLNMTSGSIRINGKDIRNNMDEIRKSLGLCPQHNLLFTDLTVGEHLLFFAKLKGKTQHEAKKEMLLLLEKLHLSDKRDAMAYTLSGGMKRKLCLGMAIIGGSEVLILDEPTSGMDPESRRELWDLLLAWRGEKTILITTHFMEEADALGDWIAIMANGTLQCHGTPLYLKKAFDTGYHLSLIVKDTATAKERGIIKNDIIKHIDSAELKDSNGNNMVFLLPLDDNSKIAGLLTFLEENKEELQIENISITITTLEDVFLKVEVRNDTDSSIPPLDIQEVNITTSAGKLYIMRINALIIKKLQFYIKKFWSYLIPTLIALAFVTLAVYLSNSTTSGDVKDDPELKLHLRTYKYTTVFYNGTKQNPIIKTMKNAFQSVVEANGGKAVEVEDVQQEIINKGTENIVYYKEHLIAGAEFNSEKGIEATALYSSIAVHSAPISLNLITNTLARVYLGQDYSITASNWPLEKSDVPITMESSKDIVQLLWSVLIPIGFLLIIGSFIIFPHMEVSTNFTQLQYMCGVKPYCYWLVNYFVDFGIYLIISAVIGAVIIPMAPYIGGSEYLTLLLIFSVYGAANLPVMYLFSRKKSAAGGFAVFVITGLFLGIIFTIIVICLLEAGDTYHKDLGRLLKILYILIVPQVGLIFSIFIFCGKAVENYNTSVQCMYNSIPDAIVKCKVYKSYRPLLKEEILLMVLSCVIYTTINILLDTYFIKKYFSRMQYGVSKVWYKYIMNQQDSHDGYKNLDNSDGEENCNSLKAKDLRKTYAGRLVVKNIGFTVNEKECLGILGVNGAGKTTTFRMLTRDEVADSGKIKIVNSKHKKPITIHQNKYLENLGYCPQIDALNFVLTGRQILTLIAKLRGVDDSQVVNKFLELFELKKYADMPCGHYSGGNKRKLSLAVALIGYPKFVLLDEPTNGVDPSSRRKFWNLIRNFKEKKDLSFILTSHSMIECEALCNSLKIMKDGRIEKEGTISELKKEQGGFNVKLKLLANKGGENRNDSGEGSGDGVDWTLMINDTFKNIEELKEYFKQKYNGTLKDEHSGLLHIYIEDRNKKWSTMFKEIERIKKKNSHLIEDYAISEASLEDIFLTVARSSKDEEEEKPKKTIKKLEEKDVV